MNSPNAPRILAAILVAVGIGAATAPQPPGDATQQSSSAVPVAVSIGEPAPDFSLTTLDGREVSLGSYSEFILVLYFFSGQGQEAVDLAEEMQFFYDQGHRTELVYLGVGTLDREKLEEFAAREGITHSLAPDPDGAITRSYLPEGGRAIFLVDHEGKARLFRTRLDGNTRYEVRSGIQVLLRDLREALAGRPTLDLTYRDLPAAPGFSAVDLDGKTHTLLDYRGQPLLVYFFEADCYACKESTPIVREISFRHGKRGIRFLGVVSQEPDEEFRKFVATAGFKFPVLLDPDNRMRRAFGALRGNPDLVWIDGAGRARWREFGPGKNLEQVLDAQARVLLGETEPVGLLPGNYIGVRYCRACHDAEYQDWLRTPHSIAALRLKEAGVHPPECNECHFTGVGQPGGFQGVGHGHMAGVQCESCHGPGGGHLRKPGTERVPAAALCLSCHVGDYPLKEPMDVALPWSDHGSTPPAATFYGEEPERVKMLEDYRKARFDALAFWRATEYVGSDRCQKCHPSEYRSWSATPHAGALGTLAKGLPAVPYHRVRQDERLSRLGDPADGGRGVRDLPRAGRGACGGAQEARRRDGVRPGPRL